MPTIVDTFLVELGLDSSKFTKSQKEAVDAFEKSNKEITRHGKGIEEASKKAGDSIERIAKQALALYAVFLGGQGVKSFVDQINTADAALGKFGLSIGESPNTIGAFDLAARSAGGSAANMNAAFDRLNTSFMELTTNGQNLPKAFYQLQQFGHRDIDYMHGRVKMMLDVAHNLRVVAKDQGTAKAMFLGRQVTGLDNGSLAMMINTPDLAKLIEEKKKLAPSDAEIAKITQFQKAWEDLTQHFEKFATTVWANLSPALSHAFDELSKWFDGIAKQKEFNASIEKFSQWIEGIDWSNPMKGFGSLKDQAQFFLDVVNKAIDAIKWIIDHATFTAEVLNKTQTPEGQKELFNNYIGPTLKGPGLSKEKQDALDESFGLPGPSSPKDGGKGKGVFQRLWDEIFSSAHAEPAVHSGAKPFSSGVKVGGTEVSDSHPMPVKLTMFGQGGAVINGVNGGSTGPGTGGGGATPRGGGSTPDGGGGRDYGKGDGLTPEQGAELLRSVGASPEEAAYIGSHMGGESRGHPNAHNFVGSDRSYGLWQINMLGAMGDERRRKWGLKSNEDLYDKTTNAKAALSLYRDWVGGRRKGPSPWQGSNRFLNPSYSARVRRAAEEYGKHPSSDSVMDNAIAHGYKPPKVAPIPKVPVGAGAATPRGTPGGQTPGGGTPMSSIHNDTQIGEIHVHTTASDGHGIAAELKNAIRYQQLAMSANGGMA